MLQRRNRKISFEVQVKQNLYTKMQFGKFEKKNKRRNRNLKGLHKWNRCKLWKERNQKPKIFEEITMKTKVSQIKQPQKMATIYQTRNSNLTEIQIINNE